MTSRNAELMNSFEQDLLSMLSRANYRNQESINENIIPRCPGLNKVSGPRYKWIVPHGSTPEYETYCEECCNKIGITGDIHTPYRNTQCNCDGFIKINKADNGLFNISFWKTDLYTFFETAQREGEYDVFIPSGETFNILIHSFNKKKQVFKYEVLHKSAGDSDFNEIEGLSKVFITHSSFVSNHSNTKKRTIAYVDSNHDGWNIIERIKKDKNLNNLVIKKGDKLKIKLYIYNITEHDFMTDNNRDIGSYTLTSNKTIIPKISPNLDKEQIAYDTKPYITFARTDHILFTKKPLEFTFNFLTDTKVPDKSNALLKKTMNSIKLIIPGKIFSLKNQLNAINQDEEIANDKKRDITRQMELYSKSLDDIDTMLV